MTDNEIKYVDELREVINRQKAKINELNEKISTQKDFIKWHGEVCLKQKAEIERLQKMLDLAENCIDEVEDALYRGEKNYYAEQAIERYKEMTEG